jgi:hypothetical protein
VRVNLRVRVRVADGSTMHAVTHGYKVPYVDILNTNTRTHTRTHTHRHTHTHTHTRTHAHTHTTACMQSLMFIKHACGHSWL